MSDFAGIGVFAIGVSAISGASEIAPFDVRRTIALQYANSPRILALIDLFASILNTSDTINGFYKDVFDVLYARGYGLDVWGRIVGVGRYLYVANVEFIGFEEATTASAEPLNQGTFYTGGNLTGAFALSDDAYRMLILVKAASNLSDGSILASNNILRQLFPGRGNAYVVDNRDMTMTYRFDFPTSPVEQTIILQSGVLPEPAGVTVSVDFGQ